MSDYLDRLIAKGRESLWDDDGNDGPPEVVQSIHTVKHDGFDELTWKMLRDQVGVLNDAVHSLAEDHSTSEEAQEDLFNLLHQTDPQFRDDAEVKPTHRPQRTLLESLAGTDEFQNLRDTTVLDEYSTAFSQLMLQDPLRQAFDKMAEAREAQQQAQQQLADVVCHGPGGKQGGQPDPDALQQAIEQVEQANTQAQQTAQEQVQQVADQAHDATQQLKSEGDQMAQWGLGAGDLKQMDFAERRALVEKLHKSRLSKLSKLIGSFRQFADAERRRKVRHAPEERFDVTVGSDLTKLVPSEINNLAIPELEDQFWLRYAKRSLLQWSEDGSERAGQGPIIVVCDESYSMNKELSSKTNTREAWSKAVSLALADQAQRGNRDFTYIGFAGDGQVWERTFKGGRLSLDDMIDFTEHFFAGGTEYTGPLTRAMEIVDDYARRGQARPDIVLITDDECKVPASFTERFLAAKARTDAKCYGIQVGGDTGFGTLKTLADHTLSITRLTASPEGVQDLFRTI